MPHTSGISARITRRIAAWRTEPWPLYPLAQMPGTYKVALVGVLAAHAMLALSVWFVVGPTVPNFSWAMFVPALLVIVATSTFVFRSTESTGRSDAAIVIVLAVAGYPLEAIACAVASCLIGALRKPLPRHLVTANILDSTFGVMMTFSIATWARETWGIASFGWPATVLIGLVITSTAAACSIQAVLKFGNYTPSWREAWIGAYEAVRSSMLSEMPMIFVVGTLLTTGYAWTVLLLVIPVLLSFEVAFQSDRAVQASIDADKDPLTGLGNRRVIESVAARMFPWPAPAHAREHAWVLMCDLDNFKRLNDTLGHDAGDQALITVAQQLSASIRHSDHCARFGGEEFVVIVERADAPTMERIAERIRARVEETLADVNVTVSIGVHRISGDDTYESALNSADQAMYESKRNGKNAVTFSATQQSGADGRQSAA